MGNVIDFASRKKPIPAKPTVDDIVVFCVDDILDHWDKAAKKNRLSEYFIESVYFLKSIDKDAPEKINYLESLTAISVIESKLGMGIRLANPEYGDDENDALPGWIAGFRLGDETVITPYMVSEAYARCFNILAYLKIQRELTAHGLI